MSVLERAGAGGLRLAGEKNADGVSGEGNSEGRFFTARKILVLLIVAAFLIRLLFVLYRPLLSNDEVIYAGIARNINMGRGLQDMTGDPATIWFPLLPVMIAAAAHIVPDYIVAAHAVLLITGSLLLIPVFLLGKQFINEKAGLMAAALASVFPVLIFYSAHVYTEVVYTFFLLTAVYFAWKMLNSPRIPYAAAAGGALGLGYLSNPGAFFYLVALAFLAAASSIKKKSWRAMAAPLAVFLLAFIVLAAPYLLFLHANLGRWTYSGKNGAANITAAVDDSEFNSAEWARKYTALTDDGQDLVVNRMMGSDSDPVTRFLGNPLQATKTFAANAYGLYGRKLNNIFPVWLFSLLGLAFAARKWNRRGLWETAFLLLMMAPALFILTIDYRSRFFVPFVTISLIWVARGWQKLEHWSVETALLITGGAGKKALLKIVPLAAGAALLLPMLPFSAAKGLSYESSPVIKEAGQLINRRAGSGKKVLSFGGAGVAYYADAMAVNLPYADYDQTTNYARLKGVDYLVIETGDIRDNRPGLSRLLSDDSSHREWKLVDRIRPGTSRETLIFELEKM